MAEGQPAQEPKRVLFVTVKEQGHFLPLVGPAKELLSRGYRVDFASVEQLRPKVESHVPGAGFVSLGAPLADEEYGRMLDECMDPKVTIKTMKYWSEAIQVRLLGGMAKALLEHLAQRDTRRPACIVSDVITAAGKEVAEKMGFPLVMCNNLAGIGMYLMIYGHMDKVLPSHLPLEDHIVGVLPLNMSTWQRYVVAPLKKRAGAWLFAFSLLPLMNKRREQLGLPPLRSLQDMACGIPEDRFTMACGLSWLLEVERPLPVNWHMVGPMFQDFTDPSKIPKLEDEKVLSFIQETEAAGEKFVYVAMGSVVKIPEAQLLTLARGLNAMPGARFLWALRDEDFTRLPEGAIDEKRVMRMAWAPQVAVLFHPSTAAFVSHGGLGSTMEGLSAGKPVLCLPWVFDQPVNAQHIADRGVGLSMPIKEVTPERFDNMLRRLLEDGSFTQAAARMGEELRKSSGPKTTADLVERLIGQGS